jgi:hypothetical protein
MRKLFLLLFVLGCRSDVLEKSEGNTSEQEVMEVQEQAIDKIEKIQKEEQELKGQLITPFPKPEHAEIIVRMQAGIPKWKKKVHHGWWECGKEVSSVEKEETTALRWAFRIVQLSWEHSDDDHKINPWGLAGIVANESGFDRCAVGPFLREWGYRKGAMKKKRGGAISHSVKEIERWLFDRKVIATVSKSGFDAGPMQELWRCNKARMCRSVFWTHNYPSISFESLFSMDVQFNWGVRELLRRARVNKTTRPWAYWRTGRNSEWYDKKITRWARMLGAKRGEI